jgi:hypothetical protein
MSAAAAALLGLAVGLVVLVIDLVVPFEPIRPLDDDIERGSTTIMPEDR